MTNTLDIVTASLAMPEEAGSESTTPSTLLPAFCLSGLTVALLGLKAGRRRDGLGFIRGLKLEIVVGDLFVDLDVGIFCQTVIAGFGFNKFLLHRDSSRVVDPKLDVGKHLLCFRALRGQLELAGLYAVYGFAAAIFHVE